MKKIILLCLLVLPALGAVYAQKSNHLVVFNQDGNKFWLILNGVKQNENPETNVKVIGLIQPSYDVRLIFEVKSIPDIAQKVYLMWEGEQKSGYEFNYSVAKTKKGYKLRPNSAAPYTTDAPGAGQVVYSYTTGTPMPYGVVKTTTTTGTTTATGTGTNENVNVNVGTNTTGNGVNMNTSTTTSTGTGTGSGTTDNVNVNMNVNGLDLNVNVNTTTTGTTTSTTTTGTGYGTSSTTTTSTSYSTSTGTTGTGTGTGMNTTANHYVMPGYNGPMGCPWPMNEQDFESAKNSIKAKSFDDSRLKIAQQIIGSNCLLCSQVKELMLLMSFEQTRLDLAKFSYGRTYDQGNYYKLNDAFTFESSIDELNEYIKGK